MFAASRRNARTPNIWPGYVDALSALLMVVIFVLLVFAFAHFLLSEISAGIIEIGRLLTTDTFNKPFTPYRVILYLRGERWGLESIHVVQEPWFL